MGSSLGLSSYSLRLLEVVSQVCGPCNGRGCVDMIKNGGALGVYPGGGTTSPGLICDLISMFY